MRCVRVAIKSEMLLAGLASAQQVAPADAPKARAAEHWRYVQRERWQMLKRTIYRTAVFFMAFLSCTVAADTASDFRGMEGWTIIATTQVEDEFEGCDFDKVIKFMNGMALKCSTFSYTYSFMPNAVIFAKSAKHKDMEFYQIKALIGDKLYDMAPQVKR